MEEEELKSLMPSSVCEKFPDGTTSLCSDKDRTLAGESATLTAKILDGRVISVGVENISIAQAAAGANVLAVKFGSPDKHYKVRADLHKADNNCGSCLYPTSVWLDGNVKLFTVVNDWYNKKKDYSYSAIFLQDSAVHNGKWVPKYNGKPAASEI